jgi:hypothetical protein
MTTTADIQKRHDEDERYYNHPDKIDDGSTAHKDRGILLAKLAKVEKTAKQDDEDCKHDIEQGMEIQAELHLEVQALEAKLAAVEPYLAHKPVCKWFDTSLNAVERSIACDCGLKEALK